jgi:mono/diheme cytochrome c family protein
MYRRFTANEAVATVAAQDLAQVRDDPNRIVRLELVQTLGLVPTSTADSFLEPILKLAAQDKLLESLMAGFYGQEVEFLAARLSLTNWANAEPWREQMLDASARVLWRRRDPLTILRLSHLLGAIPGERSWQQIALLEGIKDPPPREPRGLGGARPAGKAGFGFGFRAPRALTLPSAPVSLDALRQASDPRLAAAASAFAEKLVWPGKDGRPLPERTKFSPERQRLFELGQREYVNLCAACHHPAGYGLAAKGPPLLGSDWLENEERLAKLILHGIQGPIMVNGDLYNSDNRLSMPGMYQTLDDEKIAAVMTFVRREFHTEDATWEVSAVEKIRAQYANRTDQWTEADLVEAIPASP